MILPDFLDFEPFNLLRQTMGATELGQFEFFDPQQHLTAEELKALETVGLKVPLAGVRSLADSTLAYKNSRVLLYPLGQRGEPIYHLASCDLLQQARANSVGIDWAATVVSPEVDGQACHVCSACLQTMQYQSFDAVRSRHREYSQRVRDNFSVLDFFKRYPCYPLQEKPPENIF